MFLIMIILPFVHYRSEATLFFKSSNIVMNNTVSSVILLYWIKYSYD